MHQSVAANTAVVVVVKEYACVHMYCICFLYLHIPTKKKIKRFATNCDKLLKCCIFLMHI